MDGVVIAAPDHWHAPAAILALRRGQARLRREAVQPQPLEASCSWRPPGSTTAIVQMGNQRRSWPNIIDLMRQLRDGA